MKNAAAAAVVISKNPSAGQVTIAANLLFKEEIDRRGESK